MEENPGQMQMVAGTSIGAKKVPTGVKIISVLYYIGAVAAVVFGIFFIAGSSLISSIFSEFLGTVGASLFIFIGIILILFGVLDFFIARGLWKGRNWARILVIIFSIIGILWAVFYFIQGSLMNGIINIVLSGLIGGYLLFSRKVKNAFSH